MAPGTDLVPVPAGEAAVPFLAKGRAAAHADQLDPEEAYDDAIRAMIDAGVARNTKASFRSCAKSILRWQDETGYSILPMTPATCIRLIAALEQRPGRYSGKKKADGSAGPFRPMAPESIRQHLKVIAHAHKVAIRPELDGQGHHMVGWTTPTKHPDVQKAFKGMVDRWIAAGHRPDAASEITPEELGLMIGTLDLRSARGVRDALILAVGYDAGLRRGEFAPLDLTDIEFRQDVDGRDYLVVHIRMSKTDRSGHGDEVILFRHPPESSDTCPWLLAHRWVELLAEAGFTDGPFYRKLRGGGRAPADGRPRKSKVTGERMPESAVDAVIGQTAHAAGLVVVGDFPDRHIVPHSMRVGAAVAAAERGAQPHEMNRHFRWSMNGTTGNRYAARGDKRRRNPAAGIWATSRKRKKKRRGGGR